MTYYPPPWPPSGQLDAEPRPSAATTIIAGVLALIGGLFGIVLSAFALSYIGSSDAIEDILPLIALVIMGLALMVGAALLFMRKRLGQWLVVIGCALDLVLIGCVATFGFHDEVSSTDAVAGFFGLAVFALPAVATIVLTVIPPTTRYLAWWPSRGAVHPPPPGQLPYWRAE